MGAWVYIITNRPNGTLYVGTTSNLAWRAWEHREGVADSFAKKYGLKRLVYAEWHDDVLRAKQREMNLKHWSRAWKVQLIHRDNPFGKTSMTALFEDVGGRGKPGHGVLGGTREILRGIIARGLGLR